MYRNFANGLRLLIYAVGHGGGIVVLADILDASETSRSLQGIVDTDSPGIFDEGGENHDFTDGFSRRIGNNKGYRIVMVFKLYDCLSVCGSDFGKFFEVEAGEFSTHHGNIKRFPHMDWPDPLCRNRERIGEGSICTFAPSQYQQYDDNLPISVHLHQSVQHEMAIHRLKHVQIENPP